MDHSMHVQSHVWVHQVEIRAYTHYNNFQNLAAVYNIFKCSVCWNFGQFLHWNGVKTSET